MTKAHTIRTLAILATILLLSGTAFAGIHESGDGVAWSLEKAGAGSALTISGPGDFHLSATFDAGESPHVSLFDKAGYFWADGTYSWQLTMNGESKARGEAAGEQGESMSGYFSIVGGSLVLGKVSQSDRDGSSLTKDIVHLDDVIIDGSLCVGSDCANGESFGFDTIRLKENNTRIKFQDTSTGTFPSNDWQLTANDSTNGGANRFSIDDIDGGKTPFTLVAGAPSNSLYVDAQGDVGLNTSNPVVELHVVDGDSPTLRLEQNGSSGFTPQTWDLAGNETNFFVRDVTNGSKLPFRIRPTAPDNSIYIDTTGDVGMGTNSPDESLLVLRTDAAASFVKSENTNASAQITGFRMQNTQTGVGAPTGANAWDMSTNTSGQFRISLGGSGVNEFLLDDDTGDVSLSSLTGTGNASVCVDGNGKLFRGSPGC